MQTDHMKALMYGWDNRFAKKETPQPSTASPPRFPLGPALRPWPEDAHLVHHQMQQTNTQTSADETQRSQKFDQDTEVSILRSQVESLTAILQRGVKLAISADVQPGDVMHMWMDPDDANPAWRFRVSAE